LFVSVTNEKALEQVFDMLKDYNGKVVDIKIVPNRGRDIGPFFTAFGQRILTDYDYVGHLHTKKTADLKDENVGKVWYGFLLDNLLGSKSGAMLDNILAKMKGDTTIGMVFPDDPNAVGWSANRIFAEPLAKRLGLENLPAQMNFPVGTMFWARTSALGPMINLNFSWNDFPEEPLPYDGSMLHAIERLLPLLIPIVNYRIVTTNVVGLSR
jgi:lipopolysaccharide biosynthesis protein